MADLGFAPQPPLGAFDPNTPVVTDPYATNFEPPAAVVDPFAAVDPPPLIVPASPDPTVAVVPSPLAVIIDACVA